MGTAKAASYGTGRELFRTYRLGHQGFFYWLRKRDAAGGGLVRQGCGDALSRPWSGAGESRARRGEWLYCIFKVQANKRFV